MISQAFVSLVGAGPGDPGLLTLRGQQLLGEADVVLFDYLVSPELLQFCPQAQTIYVGKKGFGESVKQEQTNALLVQKALENGGQRVVRLKGGDVFVFGRGSEEAQACVQAGIPFEVVPGITSAIAAPAYAGIPVTHREWSRSFAVLTGATKQGRAHYERLAGVDTLVLLMGMRRLAQIAADLIAAGRDPQTPAATIQRGSLAGQRVVTGTLATIAQAVQDAGLEAPAVTVVGEVVRLRETLEWFTPTRKPLAGKTVAVTRTREGASGLVGILRRRGAEVLEVPLIRFAPSSDEAKLHQRLRDLRGISWLVLSSNQAVTALFEQLERLELDGRHLAGIRVATVGPSTAQTLLGKGIRADFVPTTPGARYLGAQLPARSEEVVLHLTSQLAEDELQRALAARGLGYQRAELYRTEPAELDPHALSRLKVADLVTLASGSTARHLAQLAGTDLRVAVMGPQTEKAARDVGFTDITVALTASLDALADAVVTALG